MSTSNIALVQSGAGKVLPSHRPRLSRYFFPDSQRVDIIIIIITLLLLLLTVVAVQQATCSPGSSGVTRRRCWRRSESDHWTWTNECCRCSRLFTNVVVVAGTTSASSSSCGRRWRRSAVAGGNMQRRSSAAGSRTCLFSRTQSYTQSTNTPLTMHADAGLIHWKTLRCFDM